MTLQRTMGYLAATAVAAAGFCGPAQAATPLLNGTYQSADADEQSVWDFATSCREDECSGTVTSNQGWSSPMTVVDGHWNFSITKPDGAVCTSGDFAPVVIWVAVDPVSLAGVFTYGSDGSCEVDPVPPKAFQLTRIGP